MKLLIVIEEEVFLTYRMGYKYLKACCTRGEVNMSTYKEKIDKIIESVKPFEKMYELIRVIDPVYKEVLVTYGERKAMDSKCYEFWIESDICDNCISMRAYNNQDSYIKMECTQSKVYAITAIPVVVDGTKLVVEMLKDGTESILIGYGDYKEHIELQSIINGMNSMAVKDSLTGVYNRRFIGERLPADMISSSIHDQPLSIIIIDIDNFKQVNDTYGHVVGDRLIKEFASCIISSIRAEGDWVARYGGDEFLVCLSNADNEMAYKIAERMRSKVESHVFIHEDEKIKMTASFGIYTISQEGPLSIDEFIDLADKNLYKAKKQGKNKVQN